MAEQIGWFLDSGVPNEAAAMRPYVKLLWRLVINIIIITKNDKFNVSQKPNSITVAGLKLVRSWFEAGSKVVADLQWAEIWPII